MFNPAQKYQIFCQTLIGSKNDVNLQQNRYDSLRQGLTGFDSRTVDL